MSHIYTSRCFLSLSPTSRFVPVSPRFDRIPNGVYMVPTTMCMMDCLRCKQGFSEVVGLRVAETAEVWRLRALIVASVLFVRWLSQLRTKMME